MAPTVLIVLLLGLLAGCGPESEQAPLDGGGTGGGGNAADVAFAQAMIPHHEQSIELAELVPQRRTSDYVRELAAEITRKETAEIERMAQWLRAWGAAVPSAADHAGHAMPGMLAPGAIPALQAAPDDAFEQRWLRTLATHLGHGIDMAEKLLAQGSHPGTRTLAENIVNAQQAEVATINDRLAAARG
ncbi:DUF305 domain-containing protein [Prauserella muralis]|nr:DUF305 domain-containing protein [Prauserella muralis]